jgi:hypothetical protein
VAKEFNAENIISYNKPEVPNGRLQINSDGDYYPFPIREESASRLARNLQKSLEVAYKAGFEDGTKIVKTFSSEKPKSASGRIERVYVHGIWFYTAAKDRTISHPQATDFRNIDVPLFVQQINTMIEDAEERGREEGYEKRLREEDDPIGW